MSTVKELEALVEEEDEELEVPAGFTAENSNGHRIKDAKEPRTGSRHAVVVQMWRDGMTRSEIAKELGVRYQTVYTYTRDVEGGPPPSDKTQEEHAAPSKGRGRIVVELEDGTQMPRTEYIRQRFADGAKRAEIAKELGVTFQTVYAATKPIKTGSEEEESTPKVQKVSAIHRLVNADASAAEDEEEIEDEDGDLDAFPPAE